jgi:hypothetical protein
MASNRVFQSVLLTASVLLVGACASQPEGSLLETKFERTAKHYQKYQRDGQTVYCKKEKPITSAISHVQCLSEAQLRAEVESMRRTRNAVTRPVMPGTGQGGIG